ncbi:MAG: hypothetical protein V4603_10660 [Pseudomonadota bacterium]
MQLQVSTAQLQQVIPETAPQHLVNQSLFPAQQVLAERATVPGGKRLIRSKIMGG